MQTTLSSKNDLVRKSTNFLNTIILIWLAGNIKLIVSTFCAGVDHLTSKQAPVLHFLWRENIRMPRNFRQKQGRTNWSLTDRRSGWLVALRYGTSADDLAVSLPFSSLQSHHRLFLEQKHKRQMELWPAVLVRLSREECHRSHWSRQLTTPNGTCGLTGFRGERAGPIMCRSSVTGSL